MPSGTFGLIQGPHLLGELLSRGCLLISALTLLEHIVSFVCSCSLYEALVAGRIHKVVHIDFFIYLHCCLVTILGQALTKRVSTLINLTLLCTTSPIVLPRLLNANLKTFIASNVIYKVIVGR